MAHFQRKALTAAPTSFLDRPGAAERRLGAWSLTLSTGERLRALGGQLGGRTSTRSRPPPGLDVDEAGYRLHWCKGDYFRMKRPPALPTWSIRCPAATAWACT